MIDSPRGQPRYLLIGAGRLATHLRFYFQSLGIDFFHWSRSQNSEEELRQWLRQSEFALLAIPDAEIEDFCLRQLSDRGQKQIVHFSGRLQTTLAMGIHPMGSFGEQLFDLHFYKELTFVSDKNSPLSFSEIFPRLENFHLVMSQEDREVYHALCAVSGNFTALLWKEALRQFKELGLNERSVYTYSESVFRNILSHPDRALTGPLVRGDQETVEQNILSLKGHPLQQTYIEMKRLFQEVKI